MSHHGHFMQSWLPVEDNNVPIAHVPFHLGRRSVESLGEGGILKMNDGGPKMLCRWKGMVLWCYFT